MNDHITNAAGHEHRLGAIGGETMLAYYAAPILTGLMIGYHQAGVGRMLTRGASIVVWEIHLLIFWSACLIVLGLLSRARWFSRLPIPARLSLVAVIGLLIARPIYLVSYQLRTAYLVKEGGDPAAVAQAVKIFEFSGNFFSRALDLYGPDILFWLAINLLLQRTVALPFLPSPQPRNDAGLAWEGTRAAPSLIELPLLQRVKPAIGRELYWLKAEGHYTLVQTALGSDLVLCRFGDAVVQLASDGTQVHRSYWASNAILTHPRTRIGDGVITIADGRTIPIGPSYLAHVKHLRQRLGAQAPAMPA